jgi:hypothetical protein
MPSDTSSADGLWAITCYYNPLGYAGRLANYHRFRQELRLPLVTVEWSRDQRLKIR